MIITKYALKEMLIKDTHNFKSFVNLVYFQEMVDLIHSRVIVYGDITKDGLETELKLNLEEVMKDFIFSDILEEKFLEIVEDLI